MTISQHYRDFFQQIFGVNPFAYQERFASQSILPSLLNAPTGAGKTAAILGAWLWRRLKNQQSVGRRLVYCLPMRTLVEQTAKVAREAIERLEEKEGISKDRFAVHVLMGGEVVVDWDALPEREAVIIGTQDMLLSRALNRGYALSTARFPLQFGLLNNDCLWIFDEIQLMGDALATSSQLAAFREKLGAFGAHGSVWMSATLDKEWLKTIDFKEQVEGLEVLTLDDDDRAIPELRERLHAVKRVEQAPTSCWTPNGLARFVKERRTRDTQTLVVVNRVARAREVFAALEGEYGLQRAAKRRGKNATQKAVSSDATNAPQLELIHSRFRPEDRKRWKTLFEKAKEGEAVDRIIVATQVVEAGLDISSRLLITDIASYSSLVQRFGRCNRRGEEKETGADIFWIDRPLIDTERKLAGKESLDDNERAKIAKPYVLEQVDKARELLAGMTSAAPADLPKHSDEVNYEYVLRRRDIVDLFDTTTDLSGYDLDISRFVRGEDERDVYVAWREFQEGEPNAMTSRPAQRELCPVSIGELKEFLKKSTDKQPRIAWRWNPLLGKPLTKTQREKAGAKDKPHGWEKINAEELRPGMTVLMNSSAGGYTPERGWNGETNANVPQVPLEEVEQQPATDIGDEAYSEDAGNKIVLSHKEVEQRKAKGERRPRYAQTLQAHSTEARQKMTEILKALNNPQLEAFQEDLLVAILHHDWGKAHEVFQKTMKRGARGVLDESQLPNELLAKTFKKGAKHERRHFRHELASALALLASGEEDLRVYLAAAHHGKVRLSIRALPNEARPDGERSDGKESTERKYARGIWDGDRLPSVRLSDDVEREAVTLDLEPMLLGSADGSASWLERMICLRDSENLGVFRLAYLECLIRAADMQASANPLNCITELNSTQETRMENQA